ncbi:DUF1207 domain-containing protein [Nitrosomonas sp.]|uniref:DUF1207 domain-containing protein n=1 Tax=Nitrosomonas sp. TaxID=42353 RepID=UPI0026048163|nr:DUF1207 domain-containing protein [Nitrosomonas sp.]MCW5601479.1 DUF1207 domain-containing protein [Nitrosomonas sp.]
MRLLSIFVISLAWIFIAGAALSDDSYIAGYATGILKYEFKIDAPSLTVRNGNITLPVDKVSAVDHAKIVRELSAIPGVTGIRFGELTVQQPVATSTTPDEAIPNEAEHVPATDSIRLATGLLPSGHLFKPLLADPRWAHFSAAYRNYVGKNIDGNNNAAVSFGETLPFYRANLGQSIAQWEVGLQAGVFSDFNLDASSSDLINTDFIASIYSSMRAGNASAFARIYHQSSHLGDEFLLRALTSLERINLSYEGADLRLSYELPYGVRVYGGGGGIFHKEPSTIKPWSVQYGIEFRSPWRLDIAPVRPILAVDIKNHEQNNWNADISTRAGIQFDNFQTFNRKLQFLAEYFNGNSPTGQFFREKVEYLGLGAHYHF